LSLSHQNQNQNQSTKKMDGRSTFVFMIKVIDGSCEMRIIDTIVRFQINQMEYM